MAEEDRLNAPLRIHISEKLGALTHKHLLALPLVLTDTDTFDGESVVCFQACQFQYTRKKKSF